MTTEQPTHSRLSPSARARWQLCPGSVRACEQYDGKSGSGPAAIDGTRTHWLLEQSLLGRDHTPGDTFTDEYGTWTVDHDRAKRVDLALNYIYSRANSIPGAHIYSEKRVNPKRLVYRDDMSGTVDVQIVGDDILEIIDYKDGTIEVTAEDNPQMEQYVVAALAEQLLTSNVLFKTVRMTIIQPKLKEFGKEPISFAEYPFEHFITGVTPRMILEAEATDAPDAPMVPGEKQCRWCAHRANCSASITKQFADSGVTFNAVTDKVLPTVVTSPASAAEFDDGRLRMLVEGAPGLRKLLDAVEDEALRRFNAGHPVDGLKVVRGPGRRAWALPDDLIASTLSKMGVPKTALYKTSVITAPNVEKLKWTKRDGTEKQLTDRQLKIIREELITKGDGKLTVVPLTDKRESVELGRVETMFEAVESPAKPSWL